MKMEDYCKNILGIKEEDLATELENIYTGMVKSGAMVIKAKGATFYAIAASVVQLVKAIFSNKNTVLPVSTLLKGQYGADDICLSIPCVVNGNGVEKQIVMPITDAEQALFSEKIASLSATYDALGVRK
jgi:L-lactate dehydrogenase